MSANNDNWEVVLLELQKIIPKENLLWEKKDLLEYSRHKSVEVDGKPDIVVFPESLEQVIQIMNVCYENNMIVIPMGLNTALEGQCLAPLGGVVVNMMKMNKVISVHPHDYQVTIEPGIRISELNIVLSEYGLFFPVEPSSNPTIGGSAATSGSGMLTPRYLTTRENVVSVEVVLPNGDLISTGRRSVKSSAGYDLTNLFIGSEGTLGIITKLVVRAVPLPNEISACTMSFEDVEGASLAVVKIMGDLEKTGVSRLELINTQGIISFNEYMNTNHMEKPTIFIEIFGDDLSEIQSKLQRIKELSKNNMLEFRESKTEEERKLLWSTRMNSYYASSSCRQDCFVFIDGEKRRKSSCKLFSTDYCVPISEIGNMIRFCDKIFEEFAPNFKQNLVVHAGDGNLHHGILIDYDKPEEVELANKIHVMMLKKTIELDGTVAGEQGVGWKRKFEMTLEFNKETIDLMKSIKNAIDPKNMMNPGKLFF